MAKWLIFSMLSGKVVYSDSAIRGGARFKATGVLLFWQ